MKKKIIFQESFLVSGIMCHQACGASLQNSLNQCFQQCQKEKYLPSDAVLTVDAEPQTLGLHRVFLTVESSQVSAKLNDNNWKKVSEQFKNNIEDIGFESLSQESQAQPSKVINWLNMGANCIAIILITALSLAFPPSILLTIGLASISALATAFTARDYLLGFVQNLKNKKITNMNTTITLGWVLSFIHTLYHSISMPLISSFSMTFMNFIMPVVLILLVNGMDELKKSVISQSKKIHLQGMKDLFPQMRGQYRYYELSATEQRQLNSPTHEKMSEYAMEKLTQHRPWALGKKNALKKGMLIYIQRGECFPVDCQLIDTHTIVDTSLLTGETKQQKARMDFIPAGAVNLGQPVLVYAIKNSYNSTINQILFRSNRAKETKHQNEKSKFTTIFLGLVLVSFVASIAIPVILGVFTLPLLLQNSIGILFGICPCTIAIAHQLPNLLASFQRGKKGIIVRDEGLTQATKEMHTIVFDKTGTLTTGESEVCGHEGISSNLWERIYLLEKKSGSEHPLAKAICKHYKAHIKRQPLIKQVERMVMDSKGRGLSARVQGRLLHVGSADYLRSVGIEPQQANPNKLSQGHSIVYVAEDNLCSGLIYVKHEVRPHITAALSRLKQEGKKIIMLTGDAFPSALGFNKQNGDLFDEENIYAAQTPEDKELFIKKLLSEKNQDSSGLWFVGDGLNDASCARLVSEKGGVSCAMTADTKAAYFTDISLNGSLDYLFTHHALNRLLKKNKLQNKGLLIYSMLTFLAFISCFSIIGIALSPIIPLVIMATSTLLVLFNSYRLPLAMDVLLDKHSSWLKRFLASDVSLALLASIGVLLTVGVLLSTVLTGALALPVITFTAGAMAAITSSCIITAGALSAAFLGLSIAYVFDTKKSDKLMSGSLETTKKYVEKNEINPVVQSSNISMPLVKISQAATATNPIDKAIYYSETRSALSFS